MTIFTASTIGTVTTITTIEGVDKGEHFSALTQLNKKEKSLGCGILWSLCRDIGDLVVDYSQPCHHVKVEKLNIWEVLA